MVDFLPGDIIIANVPFSEDPTLFSKRPAMIVSKKDNNHYFIAKITRTDLTGRLKGIWIDEKSVEFKMMGLDHPSFLRLEEIIQIPSVSLL